VDDELQIMAGGIPLVSPSIKDMQLNMLIWGDSGAGKTTLAATAPGKKLLILLDPGGDLSLADREDIATLNLTAEPSNKIMSQFRSADPYNLSKVLEGSPQLETVIVDSMTSLGYAALEVAVQLAGGKSSLEQPGMHGYTYRNALILRVAVAVMRLCAKLNRHLILITHEGNAERTDQGNITSVTMALSDSVANQVGLRFNEVWWMQDNGKERIIAVRPCHLRKPMKTRLFQGSRPEFVWHYDPDTQVGEGIADWYATWQAGGGKKLPLPVRAVLTTSRGGKR
jgi:hypothetical protein